MSDRFSPPPLYDRASMRPTRSCLNCKHFDRSTGGSCKAFPEGIPYDIISGQTPHDEPLEGDRGVQWEPAPDAPLGLPAGWTLIRALEEF